MLCTKATAGSAARSLSISMYEPASICCHRGIAMRGNERTAWASASPKPYFAGTATWRVSPSTMSYNALSMGGNTPPLPSVTSSGFSGPLSSRNVAS